MRTRPVRVGCPLGGGGTSRRGGKTVSSSDSTEAVYDRHVQAFFDQDIDALLADFTDDSVIITQQAVVKGLE